MYERRQEVKRMSSTLVRVSLCLTRSRKTRTMLAWWSVAKTVRLYKRFVAIIKQKCLHWSSVKVIQAWCERLDQTRQNRHKVHRIVSSLSHTVSERRRHMSTKCRYILIRQKPTLCAFPSTAAVDTPVPSCPLPSSSFFPP